MADRARNVVVLVASGAIALAIVAGGLLAFRNLTGAADTYHVSVGAPTPGNPSATQQHGTVMITVDGRTITSGEQRVAFPYGHEVTVRPGERIVVVATSAHRAVTCTITKNPGPRQDTVAFADRSTRDPSTREWRGGCSWSRPS
jgi:large exoprotein involved in heme utilization and adhesion